MAHIAFKSQEGLLYGCYKKEVPINGETDFFGFLSAVSTVHLSVRTWYLLRTGGGALEPFNLHRA